MALGKKPFEWPQGNPRNEDDFTRLMWAIDKHLASEGRQLLYRVCEFNIERLLEEGVGWTGSYELQSGLADVPDYTGAPLLAKAYRWYKQVYGERACGRGAVADAWSVGFIAVELGNGAVWKVRIPIVWGVPRFLYDRKDFKDSGAGEFMHLEARELNVLRLVEHLPQNLVDYVPDKELNNLAALCTTALSAIGWLRDSAQCDTLFRQAYQDYVSSTANLLHSNHAQSRWDSSQAIEKVSKGLLASAGKDDKFLRALSHDKGKIREALADVCGIAVDSVLMEQGMCDPNVRYGNPPSTQEEAFRANHAVLKVAKQLSEDGKVPAILRAVRN